MDFPSSKRPATASAESVQFRLLCPASRTGAIIGKGGSVIRHLQSLTGSKIRVIDDIPVPSEERVVLITAPNAAKKDDSSNACDPENTSSDQTKPPETAAADKPGEEAPPPSSSALVRVLERIVFGDDAANADGSELDKGEFEGLCRVLVRGNQVDYLMSQGGMIREDSGASVRIASTDQIPPCAFPGDVVIQVTDDDSCNS